MAISTGSIIVDDAPYGFRGWSSWTAETVRYLSVSWTGYRPELTARMRAIRGGSCYWDHDCWIVEAKLSDQVYAAVAPTWWHVLWLSRFVANPNELMNELAREAAERRRAGGAQPPTD